MNNPAVNHVGPPEFHDGRVIRVSRPSPDRVHVRVQGSEGHLFLVRFDQVSAIRSIHPENMLLYALTEIHEPDGVVRFVFTNWDEEDDSLLEVAAPNVTIDQE